MRVALVASPFIAVPPTRYGGTELFIANLAEGLTKRGIETVVYANGDSKVNSELRWLYGDSEWPLSSETAGTTKELNHLSWAINHASLDCDIVHVNSSLAVTYSRFLSQPFVCTLHHPAEEPLTALYEQYERIQYVGISAHQASTHPTLKMDVIHHGLDLSKYQLRTDKEGYLCFLGRIAPIKGTHTAIEVAKKAGIPLKIAGEVQPAFQNYFDTMIKPHIDGKFIEYVGEADLALKNELLGGAIGMLFPISWNEPFGLVLVEAMACGTPVFAFKGGSVPEIVIPGLSGSICSSSEEMANCIETQSFNPTWIRNWVENEFSVDVMVERYIALYERLLIQQRSTSIHSLEGAAA